VTARSRERGSHAGPPRGYILPFPGHGAAPGASPPPVRAGSSRHRKPPERKVWLSRNQRLAAVFVLVVGALGVGFGTGFGSEASAEPTVQAFLLAWEQGKYAQAAGLTDGAAGNVSTQLAAAYTDLDATETFFAMKSISQHGSTAVATFRATVDLAQPGQQWNYTGRFTLIATGGRWLVHWTPSVINPSLAAGDRLAVVTSYPTRAQVEDMSGKPLIAESADYQVGVYPGRLKSPAATAAAFSKLTGLNEAQVLGQIQAAPPGEFLSLLTLEPSSFAGRWRKLGKVPGLTYQRHTDALFDPEATEAVGEVGTEDADLLREEGAAYQPGMTVGLTGLEQSYQDELTGTPTTSVVLVNPAGRSVATLWTLAGHPGTPVRTTLSSADQAAASRVLGSRSASGEIVAVDWRTGEIRALASHQAGGTALPAGGTVNGKVAPGMAFSIVSAAALLSAGATINESLPCKQETVVGGVPFTYQPATGTTDTFASDFAAGCGTAFANMSKTLTASELTATERAFGIGGSWDLHLPAFSGSATATSGAADVAAQTIGQSGVLMSPLGMAMVAAEVASGVGRAPVLIAGDPGATWTAPVSGGELTGLRQLMRLAVSSKSAPGHAADVPGAPVYGQAGVVKTGTNGYLSWFVGYQGDLAVAAVETGTTASQAAASLAGAFLKAVD
jgi:cell division protein FtsI/penicillin-binding protein 2